MWVLNWWSSIMLVSLPLVVRHNIWSWNTDITQSYIFNSQNKQYFQFGNSQYHLKSIDEGTWEDAERICESIDGHLWTINSHAEFWNVAHIITVSLHTGSTHYNPYIKLAMFGTLTFIGLKIHNNQVSKSLLYFVLRNMFCYASSDE